ncbi:type II toxin-antitoxin system RelE/ParE family toxin [Pararhodonellum marinum]|uniref:type II toxin-antitoxin system RelE/ParE family toxin n=1 Tax=Pararhodonellum marinum TaxID=2755358 RepID=UPI00189039A3
MNGPGFRISKEAIEDLDKIWLYTLKNWSLKQADRYYSQLIQEIEFVAAHYFIGKSLETIRKDYRVVKVKSHLIFYRRAEDDVIEIVRILHERMEIKRHLK